MTEEVRAALLSPRALRACKQAVADAYLPVGTLEWHGVHNAHGDALKTEPTRGRGIPQTRAAVLPKHQPTRKVTQ